MRTGRQQVPGDLQGRDSLFPGYRGKVIQETLERVASSQVIDEVLQRDTRSREDDEVRIAIPTQVLAVTVAWQGAGHELTGSDITTAREWLAKPPLLAR